MLRLFFLSPTPLLDWVERGVPMPACVELEYFGSGERPRRKPQFRIDNKKCFAEYRSKGFPLTLFADDTWCDVQCWPDRDDLVHSMSFYDYADEGTRHLELAREVMSFMDSVGADYGVAAESAEADRRNALVWAGRNRMNVGRDIRKYVPGLYWLNYFGQRYVEMHNLDLAEITERLGGELVPLTHGHFLQLYPLAADWITGDGEVSTFLASHPKYFSIDGLPRPGDFREDGSVVMSSEIFRRWP